jgi:hypothetical protein
MMNVDDTWFSGLRGVELPEPLDPVTWDDRKAIRAYWDNVEQKMRDYLDNLEDDMLSDKPFETMKTKISSCGRCCSMWLIMAQTIVHNCSDH